MSTKGSWHYYRRFEVINKYKDFTSAYLEVARLPDDAVTEGDDDGEHDHEHHASGVGQAGHPADAQIRVPHVRRETDARQVPERH